MQLQSVPLATHNEVAKRVCWYQFIHLVIVVKLPYSSCHLTWGSDNKLCREFLSVVVCATVENKSSLCILAVIYLQCMKSCLAKGIIIPFAYNSSESGSGHTSHRNLIWLIIVLLFCVHIYSQLHCFSLVRSTVIGGELSGNISPKYVSYINISFGMAFTNVIL